MILTLHLSTVIAIGALVLYSDELALMWILGKKAVLNKTLITFLHRTISLGIALMLVTGGLMYIQAVSAYLSDTTFIIKMTAIAALILNTYFIEKFSIVATSQAFASLSMSQRIPLLISGGVSIIAWTTAITCGLLLS